MAYEPTNWKTGDVVTSQKLNKLESGVADANDVLSVEMTYDNDGAVTTLNKTFGEIKQAFIAGKPVVCYSQGESATEYFIVLYVSAGPGTPETGGSIILANYGGAFQAESDDAFPTKGGE